jgi:hypothetical protein
VNNAGLFRSYPPTSTVAETNSRRKENMMGTESQPNSDYTETWSPSAEIEYATLADGTRLRYAKAGSGPALILLHTVRTQLQAIPFGPDFRPPDDGRAKRSQP